MASRKDVLLDIRKRRNTLLHWDFPFLNVQQKLRHKCDMITPVIKKHHGVTFDSADLPDPLYPNETGHLLGITPSDQGGGDVWSLTGARKHVGRVTTISDTTKIIEELKTLTNAKRWRLIRDFRRKK